MKVHPAECKAEYGVDPKVIQALNVPNPRNKRQYNRHPNASRPNGNKVDKQNIENQNAKPVNNVPKTDKDGSRKKVDTVIVESPKPTVPKSKKDRLRPMPPHLLKKEMEAQEARERAEQERIRKEEEEAEKRKIEEEKQRLKKLEEEQRLKRIREDEEKAKIEQEKEEKRKREEEAAKEKVLAQKAITSSVPQPEIHAVSTEMAHSEESEASEIQKTHSFTNKEGEDSPRSEPKSSFVESLLCSDDSTAEITRNSEVVAQANAQIHHGIDTHDALAASSSCDVDISQGKGIEDRADLETTTIDLSQLKEVTTPILEDRPPFRGFAPVERAASSVLASPSRGTVLAKDRQQTPTQGVSGVEVPVDEPSLRCDDLPLSSPQKTGLQTGVETPEKLTETVDFNSHDTQETPRKSPSKSKQPRTPKQSEPAHRILTRRKYARDEEERFKAQREASSSDTHKQTRNKERSTRLYVSSSVKESAPGSKRATAEAVSEVTSSNDGQETTDGADVRSVGSESGNSAASLENAKSSAEKDAEPGAIFREQSSSPAEQPTAELPQSVKSDGPSEDGLETIVLIIKEPEAEAKTAGTVGAGGVSDPVHPPDSDEVAADRHVEEWMETACNKETGDRRSARGKRERRRDTASSDEEESESFVRSTRSRAAEQNGSRSLRNRAALKGDSAKKTQNQKRFSGKPAPRKPSTLAKKDPPSKPAILKGESKKSEAKDQRTEVVKEQRDVEIRLTRCSVPSTGKVVSVTKPGVTSGEEQNEKQRSLRSREAVNVDTANNEPDLKKRSRSLLKRRPSTDSTTSSGKGSTSPGRILRRRQSPTSSVDESELGSRSSSRTRRTRRSNAAVTAEEVSTSRPASRTRSVAQQEATAQVIDELSTSRPVGRALREKLPGTTEQVIGEISILLSDVAEGRGRQLRRRPELEKEKSEPEKEKSVTEGRSVRSLRRSSLTDGTRDVSAERPGSRSSVRALRSSRSASWEEQVKRLKKCSIRLERCDTPTQDSDAEKHDGSAEIDNDRASSRQEEAGQEPICPVEKEGSAAELDAADKEEAVNDPLLTALEKETELVLNRIHREKDTKVASEAGEESVSATNSGENLDNTSDKDSADTMSLDMVSTASTISADMGEYEQEIAVPDIATETGLPASDAPGNGKLSEPTNPSEEEDKPLDKTVGEENEATEEPTREEKKKNKKPRSRKSGINIYELLRQQKDQIQTRVQGKANCDVFPKEKKSSPDSKGISPERKRLSSETTKDSSDLGSPTRQGRKDKKRRSSGKSSGNLEQLSPVSPVFLSENEATCSVRSSGENLALAERDINRKDTNHTQKHNENSAEELSELLELATGRTLRSEVPKTPEKQRRPVLSDYYTDKRRHHETSDFERAVQLSLEETKRSKKEKKRKKKHKRHRRDSSPFSLPAECDYSIKAKKKKHKHKHKEHKTEKHKNRDKADKSVKKSSVLPEKHIESQDEESALDLSAEQVELLEQSFEMMMPDLFHQLRIASPTEPDGSQALASLSPDDSGKSEKDKKQRSPVQSKSVVGYKRQRSHEHKAKSSSKKKNSPRVEEPSSEHVFDFVEESVSIERSPPKGKDKPQKSKSPRGKKAKARERTPPPEGFVRTTRAKYAQEQAEEFFKQTATTLSVHAQDAQENESDKTPGIKEKPTSNKRRNKGRKERQKEPVVAEHDVQPAEQVVLKSSQEEERRREEHRKKREHEERRRAENLFLQDISQTPKFFDHNLPLDNRLAQGPLANPLALVASIAPIHFPSLTDSSRKRGPDCALHSEPPAKVVIVENNVQSSVPPKRKRGRPPKSSKAKAAAHTAASVPSQPAANIAPTQALFNQPYLSTGVFTPVATGEEQPSGRKGRSSKRGKKRKRGKSSRQELEEDVMAMDETVQCAGEVAAPVGYAYSEVYGVDQVEIKQEADSSGAEEPFEEARQVIMVDKATMTDISHLQDLELEQQRLRAEYRGGGDGDGFVRAEAYSPRLFVKLYRCDASGCTKTFTQRWCMVHHKIKEHGNSCLKSSIDMHILGRRVMRRVMTLTKWRRHVCDRCGRRFNRKHHLNFHRSVEHRLRYH